MDRFSFNQIAALVIVVSVFVLAALGMMMGNRSSVTVRVCGEDASVPCRSYTVEVMNSGIHGDTLKTLAENIVAELEKTK
jgi:hypothetical protein